jgi:galactitol-specific phosphotransferase system IIB component
MPTLFLTKAPKAYNGEKTVSSQMLLEKVVTACKKLKLDPCLSICANSNSKWIKDLNIRPKTLKLVQERAGNTLKVIGIGKDFLNRTPVAQQLRERIDK